MAKETRILEIKKQRVNGYPEREGAVIRVDDFDMWLEVHGSGPPLLMLNGGFGMTAMVGELLSEYAKYFTVYAFDARGHGRSRFGRGPVTYAREAADAVALMDVLGLEDSHIFGHSDGGCASLHLLFDYPHRVRSSTLSGTPYGRDSYGEDAAQFVVNFPRLLARGEVDDIGMHERLTDQGMSPEQIQKLARGLERAWSTTPNFSLEMLATFSTPVLVVEAGEDEFLDLSVFTNMTENIPGARSIRLPEMTHSPSPFESQLSQASWALAKEVDAESDSAAG